MVFPGGVGFLKSAETGAHFIRGNGILKCDEQGKKSVFLFRSVDHNGSSHQKYDAWIEPRAKDPRGHGSLFGAMSNVYLARCGEDIFLS